MGLIPSCKKRTMLVTAEISWRRASSSSDSEKKPDWCCSFDLKGSYSDDGQREYCAREGNEPWIEAEDN